MGMRLKKLSQVWASLNDLAKVATTSSSAAPTNVSGVSTASSCRVLGTLSVNGMPSSSRGDTLSATESSSLDSLGVAVDEAHKQGIQLHAYINALVAPKTVPTSGKHILVSHPEYVCLDASGNVISDDGYTWVAAEDGYIDYYKKDRRNPRSLRATFSG